MAKEVFSRFDAADYLQTNEDIDAFLDAAMEEGGDDPEYIAVVLGTIARARNMSQLARGTGLSREGLSRALSGNGNPTMATLMKVAKALDLKIQVVPAVSAGAASNVPEHSTAS